FKTKSDLLSEIMKPMIPELKKEFLPKLKAYQTLDEAVHFIIKNRFHFLTQNADFIKILIQEVLVNPDFRQTLLTNFKEVAAEDYILQMKVL
ncbi:TetR/AcrR family transcriptional regulator, partial [Streptococcus pyogenes]